MIFWTLASIHLLVAVACVVHVLWYYRRPAAAVGWMFALIFLPLFGPLLYLMLAVYQGSGTLRRRRRAGGALRAAREVEAEDERVYAGSLDRAGFPRLMRSVCSFAMTAGNRIELIERDEAALERQLEAIRAARHEVLLETYVLKPGAVFERLSRALRDSAGNGARVRLLVDPIGSQELPEHMLTALRGKNLEVHNFLKPNPFKGRFQINFRNHRKILCIDNARAYTGGRNWADEYYGSAPGGTFRDTTFEVEGPVVWSLRRVFFEDWAVATGQGLGRDVPRDIPAACGSVFVRSIPSGPDEPRDAIVHVLSGAFRAARETITVITPYFVPGPRLHHELEMAARSGVAVTVLMPRESEERLVDLASRYYVAGLLDAGARVFLRQGPMLHAKAVIVDDRWATVGSVNFDCRSFDLNYELNLEVPGEEFAGRLRGYFEKDLAAAIEIDPERFAKRRAASKIAERAAALFSPVL